MAHIIIASHGGLSRGIVDSLHMVAGDLADGIETYSLELGQNPNDYYEELRVRVEADPEQFIILCDILGGSVHNALFRLTESPNVALFSGVTLGMALEVVLTCRDGIDPTTAERVRRAACYGVTVRFGGSCDAEVADDEDF